MLQITFSPEKDGPLYQQLYRAVTAQIRSGQLAAGEKMPGKRTLAGQLGVSVNTVDGAYQILAAEGWLEARPRSGYYVRPYQRPLAPAAPAPGQGAARRSLEDTEMRIRRYPAPVSIQATAADQEVVCLLRRQNELLTEILGVLNAQLAVGLEQFRSGT